MTPRLQPGRPRRRDAKRVEGGPGATSSETVARSPRLDVTHGTDDDRRAGRPAARAAARAAGSR